MVRDHETAGPTPASPTVMRINVFLAQELGISRRAADGIMKKGRVRCNGETAKVGQLVDPAKDRVAVDGTIVENSAKEKVTIALYKPEGYVTTKSDPRGRKTVMNLLPQELGHLKPIGRLDYKSEGLLLLSNDGSLIFQLTHPKYKKEKEYRVIFQKPVTKKLLETFQKGVLLPEGLAKADTVKQIGKNEIEVVIHQGWNRQLRRMAEQCHYEIARLIRTRMGETRLEDLQPGQWRKITTGS